ncbi:MAG: phosphopentomutase [Bacteroidetes bacterium]|nr:MAG: phosphopentomutase [Bacteroidota bacterium]
MIRRVILVVLDSVGIGDAPDADKFGDFGSNTLRNIAKKITDFSIPNLRKLGLANIDADLAIDPVKSPTGAYGKAKEVSPGKDTTSGHWEIAGLQLTSAFPTFPNGFPQEVITEFENKIETKCIGNYTASGTVIINELGDEHVKTGYPIVYTSADSVFQIAMHEDIIPINKQFEICQKARDILVGPYEVGRVIARPFVGKSGNYLRTTNRRDFSLIPFEKTVLNHIADAGKEVIGIGKIEDIYAQSGITEAVHTISNKDGVERTLDQINKDNQGLIFTNLVDFDSQFGHRRNVEGYAKALLEFDKVLPDIQNALKDDDVLILTADHGNDPTFKGTDHTREQVPILIYGKHIKPGVSIGNRETFADIGATISDLLNVHATSFGTSFKDLILQPEYATSH